jgi:HK97 family phage major capsid protein
MASIKELKQQCGALQDKMIAMQKKADDENRKMTPEENALWDRMDADFEAARADILRREKVEAHAAQLEGRVIVPPTEIRPGTGAAHEERTTEEQTAIEKAAFSNYLRFGIPGLSAEHKQIMGARMSSPSGYAPRKGQIQAFEGVGTGSAGGYLVPQGFSDLLEKFLKAYGGMRQSARIFPTPDGRTIPWPTVDDTANVGEIIAENQTYDYQDVPFGSISLLAYKYSSKMVNVSVELLQDSYFDIDSLLAELLAERIGRATNAHFTTGTGTSQPLGVMTACGTGTISPITGAPGDATSCTYADLVNLEHSVDPSYRPGSIWMFADSTLKALKKLTDDNGRPLWQSSLAGLMGSWPDNLMGYPYVINQQVATMAANARSILFGNLSKYIIRDARDITVVRLVELYAAAGQVGFLAFSRHDGRPTNPNAFNCFINSAT